MIIINRVSESLMELYIWRFNLLCIFFFVVVVSVSIVAIFKPIATKTDYDLNLNAD